MSRERRVCRHSVIMSVVGVVVRLSSRPTVDRLLIAVGLSLITETPVCLRGVIMIVSGVSLATVLKLR